MSSLLKATAVAILMASVLAATAEAAAVVSYISTIASPDFLTSPAFFWMTANAIIIWLFSSSRRGSRTDDGDHNTTSPSPGHDDGEAVHDSVDTLYASSSEYEAFSDASTGSGRRADAQVPKRLARDREARAARRSHRPRVRKKPAAGQDEPIPRTFAVAAAARQPKPDDEIRIRGEWTPVTVAAVPRSSDDIDDDEDVSMDSLWQSIVQRRAARPVVVQKSESWGNDELPRLQRVAETAAATPRREMRKSVSAVTKAAAGPEPEPRQPPPPSVPSAVKQLGWRTRDELVAVTPDDLLRRAESFIRRQWEHLRLQRQESEQRQRQRLFQLPAAAGPRPIRV